MKVIIVALTLLLICCSNPMDSSRLVMYTVTSTCNVADIDYADNNGDTNRLVSETLPWEYTVTMKSGDWAYVEAWIWVGGTLTVSIYVDGDLVAAKTSNGELFCNASTELFIE